jgi:hypothetical protein
VVSAALQHRHRPLLACRRAEYTHAGQYEKIPYRSAST